MKTPYTALALFALLASAAVAPAHACGFGEAPDDCGQTDESNARYMLLRVASAVKTDEGRAIANVQHGTGGFRTQDTYVFCVNDAGVMTAHPDPRLQGHDVRDLHDATGNYFIATMMRTAEQGKVASIHYLFPRPGQTEAVSKTTYYTRAADQVCGVGVYEGGDAPAVAPPSRQDRIGTLRSRLSAIMPAPASSDWAEYLRLSDEQTAENADRAAKLRVQAEAVAAALAPR